MIVPFTAGEGVEETDQLDKVSLMLVKGVYDTFQDASSHLKMLEADKIDDADFIIQGHIVSISKPSKVNKLMLSNGKKQLQVQGKMTDAKTGETVVLFDDHQETSQKDEDCKHLGYVIGENISHFILSGLE